MNRSGTKIVLKEILAIASSSGLTHKTAQLHGEEEKCGEIFIGKGKFIFLCALCGRRFRSMHYFGVHISSQHVNAKPEVAIDQQRVLVRSKEQSSSNSNEEPTQTTDPLHCPTPPPAAEYEGSSNDEKDEVSNDKSTASQSNSMEQNLSIDKLQVMTCRYCDKKFTEIVDFMKHPCRDDVEESSESESESTVSQSDLTEPPNPTAEEITPPQSENHIHLDPSTQPMTCKYCDKQFVDISEFMEHCTFMHNGPKKYHCPHCTSSFKTKEHLKLHISTHTGERPYQCSYCPKAFTTSSNCTNHEQAHLGIKQYKCKYCDKTFTMSSYRKVHEARHKGEKLYQCEECGKRYARPYLLTRHKARHTNTRAYKCNVCDKAFFTPEHLRDHSIVHSKERPYECNVCGQNFPRRRALRSHSLLHSDTKKYVCTVCGKAFAQYTGLYSHKKSHVKELA